MAEQPIDNDQWIINAQKIIERAQAVGHLTPTGANRLMARINNVRQAIADGNQELVDYNRIQFGEEAEEEVLVAEAMDQKNEPMEGPEIG